MARLNHYVQKLYSSDLLLACYAGAIKHLRFLCKTDNIAAAHNAFPAFNHINNIRVHASHQLTYACRKNNDKAYGYESTALSHL